MHDEIYTDDDGPLTTDEAWAVGLFEGEGCLTLSDGRPRIKLNSTDEDVVRRFHAIVGLGQVREERAMEKRGWKRQWEWYSGCRDDVVEFIARFFHHFGHRRQGRACDLLAAAERFRPATDRGGSE
jgi:hypothetical protein